MMNRKTHNIGTVGVDLLKAYTPMGEPQLPQIGDLKINPKTNVMSFVSDVKRIKKYTCK